jgi:hypothetical protein
MEPDLTPATPPAEPDATAAFPPPAAGAAAPLDLDAIEADLAGVEAALARLDAGTYWADEVTGQPLGDEFMAAHPIARRTTDVG